MAKATVVRRIPRACVKAKPQNGMGLVYRNLRRHRLFLICLRRAFSERSSMSAKNWFRTGAAAILRCALNHSHRSQNDDTTAVTRNTTPIRTRSRPRPWRWPRAQQWTSPRKTRPYRYDDHDRDAARGWYRAHYSHLPPGLLPGAITYLPGLEPPTSRARNSASGPASANAPLPARIGSHVPASASELYARRGRRKSGISQPRKLPDRGRFSPPDRLDLSTTFPPGSP